ncbi:MAG: SCP2 sterol-binding domain-containing protein [Lachnospiraceae bacterium]
MTYADFFYEIKNKFMGADVSDIHEHLAFQFDIEDEECGGIFYVEVKNGELFVEPYEYFDRDAKFIASPDTFVKISEGKLDPIAAFTMQKLKVEGSIDKALRLKDIIDAKKKQEKQTKKTKRTCKKKEESK